MISDGHYTICKFTTNYRVGMGTSADRECIDKMTRVRLIAPPQLDRMSDDVAPNYVRHKPEQTLFLLRKNEHLTVKNYFNVCNC
jgi:hypothetical protein